MDCYRIEVVLASDHPHAPPVVYETGYRIPRVSDRHVNQGVNVGSLCLGVPEEIWGFVSSGLDIGTFLDGPVRSFLVGNSLVERGEPWPSGEWAHGAAGICRFYEQQIGIGDPEGVRRLLEYLERPRIKGHWPCPCGSGAKLRNCHMRPVLELQKRLPQKGVRESLRQFAGKA